MQENTSCDTTAQASDTAKTPQHTISPGTGCDCLQCDLAALHREITRIALKNSPAIADKLGTIAILISRLMLHGAAADFRIVDQVEPGYDSTANLRARNKLAGGNHERI